MNYSPRYPLLLFHNREEDITRPTSKLVLKENILGAIDLKQGGTAAIGMNVKTGEFGLLTNVRMKQKDENKLSRGIFLSNVLQNKNHNNIHCGDYHMYSGSLFLSLNDPVKVEYNSNILYPEYCVKFFFEFSDFSIIVRMNEHPTTESFWKKKNWLERELYNRIVFNTDIDSLCKIVIEILSKTEIFFNEEEVLETNYLKDDLSNGFVEPFVDQAVSKSEKVQLGSANDSERIDDDLDLVLTNVANTLLSDQVDHTESAELLNVASLEMGEEIVNEDDPRNDLSWSPFPYEIEAEIQRHIFVPKIVFPINQGAEIIDAATVIEASLLSLPATPSVEASLKSMSATPSVEASLKSKPATPSVEASLKSKSATPPPKDVPPMKYGTVSQTMIYVDAESREVNYQYRTVIEEKFSSWDHRVIPH